MCNNICDNKKKENCLIIFTRIPEPNKTKTRMMPYLTPDECALLHKSILMDISENLIPIMYDIVVFYCGGADVRILKDIFGENVVYKEQRGDDIGVRMRNAIAETIESGYKKVVLVGADIPEIRNEVVENAFTKLDTCDVVIGGTCDGGYYLIGMKQVIDSAFGGVAYGNSIVYEDTIKNIEANAYSIGQVKKAIDLDERGDLVKFYTDTIVNDESTKCPYTIAFINKILKISIIIPILNEEKNIERIINQLNSLDEEVEIIFVDGGSTDNTLRRIDSKYTIVHSKKGRGMQLNAGVNEARGDILFFLHADSELPDDAIRQIRQALLKTPIGCFGIDYHSTNFFMWTCKHISNLRAKYRRLIYGDQGMFIMRNVFLSLGGFKEIPLMEDYDFSLRLKKTQYKVTLTKDRIMTSSRRFPKGTINKLRFMYTMHKLRKMYRRGVDINHISALYESS